jgi:hypothetical protein
MNPRVQSVQVEANYRLRLAFTDGQCGVFDCSNLLDFGVFRELREPEYFRKVKVIRGTVSWPNEQDICPDTLFEEAVRKKENTQPTK